MLLNIKIFAVVTNDIDRSFLKVSGQETRLLMNGSTAE